MRLLISGSWVRAPRWAMTFVVVFNTDYGSSEPLKTLVMLISLARLVTSVRVLAHAPLRACEPQFASRWRLISEIYIIWDFRASSILCTGTLKGVQLVHSDRRALVTRAGSRP